MSAEKLFWARRRGLAPENAVIDALFFKLGQYDPVWLESTICRRRSSHIEFAPTEGFEVLRDRSTLHMRLRRLGGGGGKSMRATRRMSRGGSYELSFRIL